MYVLYIFVSTGVSVMHLSLSLLLSDGEVKNGKAPDQTYCNIWVKPSQTTTTTTIITTNFFASSNPARSNGKLSLSHQNSDGSEHIDKRQNQTGGS
uniref:Secreted protein n=1 Tax=Octopus bimaculoides TaxID=37653 RepID=A0A0L8HTB6_OCTBM